MRQKNYLLKNQVFKIFNAFLEDCIKRVKSSESYTFSGQVADDKNRRKRTHQPRLSCVYQAKRKWTSISLRYFIRHKK
jgi:hypothetical protein